MPLDDAILYMHFKTLQRCIMDSTTLNTESHYHCFKQQLHEMFLI